ncbi:hypothetical protein GF354_06195 [Candidatus Peregrinibacteria bacterium]|nr:hypothetical protein [Candidatus Peregrinibacteria bacterium]
MNETPKSSEPTKEDFYERVTETNPELLENAPRPALLDVVRLDGQWAQVGPSLDTFNFLADSNRAMHRINWDEYKLTRQYNGVNIAIYRRFEPDAITDAELENVYWGEEQKTDSTFKGRVKLFGEYERKENIT